MIYVIHALALVGAVTVLRWARELWRTRHDRGYDSHRWGAY